MPPEQVAAAPPIAPDLRARLVNLGSTGVVVGVHALCLAAPFVGCSWRLLALAGASYTLQTLGVTVGYHRYFSHHSFKTGRALQFGLGWLGCAAMQNGPIWWASGHRRHHRFSERAGDPHSPVLGGFWHGHLGWVLSGENDHPDLANVRELSRLPELRFLDRFKWLPTLATGVVCALLMGWPGVVWGLGVATTLAFHAPLFVNSAGHLWGSQRYETGDGSRNNAALGVLVLGEGWHNNHHRYPLSARHGFAWWEVDVAYYTIWALSKVGLVWDVRGRTMAPGAESLPPRRLLHPGRSPSRSMRRGSLVPPHRSRAPGRSSFPVRKS
jgi:stearoyl-CoA desaturase (Delta-9 desaturase)